MNLIIYLMIFSFIFIGFNKFSLIANYLISTAKALSQSHPSW